MDFLLGLGPELLCNELSDPSLLDVFHRDYGEFRRFGSNTRRVDSHLRFFVAEEKLVGWRDAQAHFGTEVWHLRRGTDRTFVVGTAFQPSRPYWVAGCDEDMRRFDVARLQSSPQIPVDQTVEAVLRILPRLALMHHLLEPPTGALVHAAGAVVDGRMYVFLGQSGAGKSTLCRLLLAQGGEVVNDDRLLLTRGDEVPRWTAWGTPWAGELGIARNRHAPLGALLFLEKGGRTTLEALTPSDALQRLVPLLSVPWYDPGLVARALEFCELLVTEAPAHELRFRPDRGAVDAIVDLASR